MVIPFRRVLDAKTQEIILDEGFARDLAEVAYTMQQDGHHVVAEGMRNLSRHHRIRGLKARAEIMILASENERYLGDED